MPAAPREFDINERETGTYTATVTGNDGVTAIPAVSISTFVLSLYAILANGTVTFINGRNDQNVLNANNVTISGAGLLTWAIQVADTAIQEATLPFERHIALWEWVTTAGAAGKHEIILVVKNLSQVP